MLRRAQTLRGLGVSYAAIARILSHDFEVTVDTEHLRYRLRAAGAPPKYHGHSRRLAEARVGG
jgi:hypothetical protein